MPDVFVTGGSGFVGGAVLGRFVGEGHTVRGLARSDRAAAAIAARGAVAWRGDLLDADALESGMAGCDLVVHVGGLNENCLADPGPLYRVNVGGTRTVMRAAARAGVDRVVITSSAAAIGERRGAVGIETTIHRGSYLTHYERSKHQAEQVAFSEGARLGIEVVAVNPSSVQGPGRTGGTAKILLGFLTGKLRFAVDTTLSLVSIGDTADAHLLAAARGQAGERYLVSGATMSVRDALDELTNLTGQARKVRFLPGWSALAAATAVGSAFRLFAKQAPACREIARILLHGPAYDGTKVTRELGLRYTPIQDWMAETIAWYRAEGLI